MGQRINRICLDKAAELPGVFRRASAFALTFIFLMVIMKISIIIIFYLKRGAYK